MAAENNADGEFALFEKALYLQQSGRLVEASKMYDVILNRDQTNARALLLRGIIALQSDDNKSAIEFFQRAIVSDSGESDSFYNLSIALRGTGRTKEALVALEKAVELNKTDIDIYNNLGLMYYECGDYKKAISAFKNALKIEPGNLELLNSIGVVFLKNDEYNNAKMAFKDVISINDSYSDAYSNLGNLYKMSGKFDEAEKYYRHAIKIKPDEDVYLYNLGALLHSKGELESAKKCYIRVLDLNGNNPSARHMLSAITENTTDGAPQEYIIGLFDKYSKKFEEELKTKLLYRVPNLLRNLFDSIDRTNNIKFRILDMGCGTGSCGEEFKAIATTLVGVDLSSKMLDQAQKKDIYDELYCGDIILFLKSQNKIYDLFVAADVFIYIGKLDRLFEVASSFLAENAYFLFSIENSRNGDFKLEQTGRYSHSHQYIKRLAFGNGFKLVAVEPVNIRKEKMKSIKGKIYILQYSS